MTDYISRDVAIEAFEGGNQSKYYPFEVRNRLRDIPAADVRENKRGRYEATQFEALFSTKVCSVCFNRVPIGNFCYMCGADMREEQT